MTRACLFAVLLIADAHVVSVDRQNAQTVFRAGVDVVRLDVLATDGKRPIAGLGPHDFEVIDNGVPQRVEVATTSGDVSIALVLDTSASLKGDPLEKLVAASQLVVTNLKPGDRASLVTFSSRISLEANGVADPSAVKTILTNARAAGRTALWDALFASLSLVAGRSERSLVLLFTDGVDNSSWMTRDQVAESVKRAEAVVYAVKPRPAVGVRGAFASSSSRSSEPAVAGVGAAAGIRVPVGSVPNQTAERALIEALEGENKSWTDLRVVVKQSGGDVLEGDSQGKLPEQFKAILEEFRARYLVAYEPKGVGRDDGWHRIEVRVKGRSAKIETRAGYYARRLPAK